MLERHRQKLPIPNLGSSPLVEKKRPEPKVKGLTHSLGIGKEKHLKRSAPDNRLEDQKPEIKEAIKRLRQLRDKGISLEIAENFIEKSTWWLTSVHGPVRAPGYANRIRLYDSDEKCEETILDDDWVVVFGGNQFLVARAIKSCLATAHKFLTKTPFLPKNRLISDIWELIPKFVARSSGAMYRGAYPIDESLLRFGATAIDVRDFVAEFMSWTRLKEALE